jgi:hypothetical protein
MDRGVLTVLQGEAANGDWFEKWLIGAVVVLSLFLLALAVVALVHHPVFTTIVASVFITPYIVGRVLANSHE